MARTVPSEFVPIDYSETGSTRPIDNTEGTLAANTHYLYSQHIPAAIRTTFRADADGAAGVQAYVIGRSSGSAEVSALWCIEPPGAPFLQWTCYVLAENTSTTDDATVRFDLASDPYPGTSVDITVPRSSSQWTQVFGDLDIDNTQTTDTIRMWAINGASGQVRVHHVMIIPKALSSLAGQVNTVNGWAFVPIDDDETSQDAPLSVRLRRRQHGNMMHIYRNRPGACVGWSEDTHYRVGSQAYGTTDAEYEEVARIPIFAPKGTTDIRWAAFLRKTGSGTGKMRLRTASMDQNGTTAIEADAVQSWTSPYSSNLVKYDDSGLDTLEVTTGGEFNFTQDEIIIDIKSDGSARVDLLGFSAWFEVVAK